VGEKNLKFGGLKYTFKFDELKISFSQFED